VFAKENEWFKSCLIKSILFVYKLIFCQEIESGKSVHDFSHFQSLDKKLICKQIKWTLNFKAKTSVELKFSFSDVWERGVSIPRGDIPSRRNFLEFQMGLGFWCGEWSAQRTTYITVFQTVRRKLHTTLKNICTVLILAGIEHRTPKSFNIQSVASTFPLYQRDSRRIKKSNLI
jgi:hypothetical protein